jgi:5-amino-6-(5-phosphoribosylamino)uracil reductase
MTVVPTAPPGWFELLLEREEDTGQGLPENMRAVYGGDWRLPAAGPAPYVCVNFCMSRDGRVSFSEPGHMGGGDVSGFDGRDRWQMGLLRARADAVMIGDGSLKAEPDYVMTSAAICPSDLPAFAALREAEGRRPEPVHVVVSADGDVPWHAEVFSRPGTEVVVVTTERAPASVHREATLREARVDVLVVGDERADIGGVARHLAGRWGVRTIVCEGGPRLYGAMLREGLVVDEFLTVSPLLLGDDGGGAHRPSLVEGVRFPVGGAPRSRLLGVRAGGDHLYLRSRYS